MKWSFIVFCYNEEHSIERVIRDCSDFIYQKHNGNGEIIFVNDGSTDGSLKIATSLLTQVPVLKIMNHSQNMGIGPSLNHGYDEAKGEYICAVPGDGQFEINNLLAVEDFEDKFFISFYRKKKNYTLYRNLLTSFNALFNKIFNDIHIEDVNWIKVYKKSQLNAIERKLNSSLVESEIVGKLLKMNIEPIEIPSDYIPRTGGKPKGGNLKTLIQAIKETFKLYQSIQKQN